LNQSLFKQIVLLSS